VIKVSLAQTKDIVISAKAVDKLLDLKDESVLRLYIYLAKNGSGFDANMAADRLGISVSKVLGALDVLCAKGLVQKEESIILERPDTVPEYTTEDVTNTLEKDTAFAELLDFTQKKLGKLLSTVDTQTLLGIYSWMGLPIEVICLIITYCTEQMIKKYGEGRRPTMKNIENQARIWLNMGILTTEQAEDYLRTQEIRGTKIAKIAGILHLSGRALSPTENKYVTAWADADYSEELIMEAYDITAVQTGKLSWRYMDKVLKNWESEGYKSKKDIEKATGGQKDTPLKMSEEQIAAFKRAEELSKKWGRGK